jgi:hypothetical protein
VHSEKRERESKEGKIRENRESYRDNIAVTGKTLDQRIRCGVPEVNQLILASRGKIFAV